MLAVALWGSSAMGFVSQPASDLVRLLPAEVGDWRPEGPDAVYTPAELFRYLDGGAELYISYGVRRVISRRYVNAAEPEASITVDLFDMGSSANAFGVYSHGRDQPTDEIGQGSEYAAGLLCFWKGRHYVSVLGSPESREVERAVRGLAQAIAAAIPETGPIPAIVSALPQQALVATSVRYFRHYVWLNSYLFIADDDVLEMSRDCEAVLARYRDSAGSWVLLVVRYPDAARAERGHAAFAKAYLSGVEAGVVRRPDGKWAGSLRIQDRLVVVLDAADAETVRRALRAYEK